MNFPAGMPVGAAFRVINKVPVGQFFTQFNGLSEGAFFYAPTGTTRYLMNISYVSAEDKNDVTLTHPGHYDFNAYPPDTQQWYESVGIDPYYGPVYPASSPGWDSLVMGAGRGGSEGTSLPRDPYTPVQLLEDMAVTATPVDLWVDAVATDTITPRPPGISSRDHQRRLRLPARCLPVHRG